jgi:predicted dehydrogenase
MGANHARTATNNRDVELIAVVDPDQERAEALARSYGCASAPSIADVLDEFDGAIVAAPTVHHFEMALPLLRAGKHVLVEKPITTDAASAVELLEAARTSGVALMVGHVERCNPVVLALPQFTEGLVHFESFRMGPFAARIPDSVVLDLMIHDIDIAIATAASRVTKVVAISQSTRTPTEDFATALLTFENGITAALTASRIGQQKVREIRLTQTDSVVNVDLVRNHIEINRVAHTEFTADGGRRYRQSGVVEIPFIENLGEPLAVQLRRFVAAAEANGEGIDERSCGIEALQVALAVIDACRGATPSPGRLG